LVRIQPGVPEPFESKASAIVGASSTISPESLSEAHSVPTESHRHTRVCRICKQSRRQWAEPDLCLECDRLRRALQEIVAEDPGHRFNLTDPDFVGHLYARARLIEARERVN